MSASGRPGFYGKMPVRGDFVSRRVASDFVGRWDAWLQEGLAASRAALGEQWLDVYLTSPIWRFALAPGCCGEQAQAGVMMPSVDKVGRYFPLAAVLPLGTDAVALARAMELDAWYSEVEELLLTTLAETPLDLEELDGRLAELLPRPEPTGSSTAVWAASPEMGHPLGLQVAPPAPASVGAGRNIHSAAFGPAGPPPEAAPLQFCVFAGASLCAALEPLGAENLERQGWRSFWWTQGSERVLPCFLMGPALPAGELFAAMLDGVFERHGWKPSAQEGQPRPPPGRTPEAAPAPLRASAPEAEPESRGARTPEGQPASRPEPAREDERLSQPEPESRADLTQPRGRRLATRSAAVTDVGKRRERNEDAYACRDDLGVWLVADGLGGHQAGEIASRMVTSTLRGLRAGSGLPDRIDQLVRALGVVNGCLQVLAERDPSVTLAGSTVVALLVEGSSAAMIWAGDSRLYRLRNGALEQLTRDHSEVAEGSGNHVITRAVGGPEALEVEIEHAEVRDGDRFLLCTDGLYGEVREAEIAAALSRPEPALACDDLKRAALSGEARDNLTALVVHVGAAA